MHLHSFKKLINFGWTLVLYRSSALHCQDGKNNSKTKIRFSQSPQFKAIIQQTSSLFSIK